MYGLSISLNHTERNQELQNKLKKPLICARGCWPNVSYKTDWVYLRLGVVQGSYSVKFR